MALCKFLRGDSSRLNQQDHHNGYIYVTVDESMMYFDVNVGTEEKPDNRRLKLNAAKAESLIGYTIKDVLNNQINEIPTSKAVLDELTSRLNNVLTTEEQTLTEEQKARVRANLGIADSPSGGFFAQFDKTITWNDSDTIYTESWVKDGKNYSKIITHVSDTVSTVQLVIDGVNSGLWTTTIDELNNSASTVYTAQ